MAVNSHSTARGRRHTEGDHQLNLFRWAYKQSITVPELQLLFAIPNGGHRDGSTAARMRLEGVKAGVPDMFLPVARQGFHGLWIELKAPGCPSGSQEGRLSGEQALWIARLKSEGFLALVAHGDEMARRMLVDYLGIGQDKNLLTLERTLANIDT